MESRAILFLQLLRTSLCSAPHQIPCGIYFENEFIAVLSFDSSWSLVRLQISSRWSRLLYVIQLFLFCFSFSFVDFVLQFILFTWLLFESAPPSNSESFFNDFSATQVCFKMKRKSIELWKSCHHNIFCSTKRVSSRKEPSLKPNAMAEHYGNFSNFNEYWRSDLNFNLSGCSVRRMDWLRYLDTTATTECFTLAQCRLYDSKTMKTTMHELRFSHARFFVVLKFDRLHWKWSECMIKSTREQRKHKVSVRIVNTQSMHLPQW